MKYICEHSIPSDNSEARTYVMSSEDKADYIAKSLASNGIHIEFVSNSRTQLRKGIITSRVDILNKDISVISGVTFGCNNKYTMILQKILSLLWLTYFLLRNCKKNELVLFYHSVYTSIPLIILQKIKRVRIVIEVEEVFFSLNNKEKSWWRDSIEKKALSVANGYIFASDVLQQKCNVDKPYVIVNGKYEVPEIKYQIKKNKKITLIYAGLIREQLVAFKAIRIAKYLSEEYCIRVIGYGSEDDILLFRKEIQEINKTSACKVYYDGIKRGSEYNEYLQNGDYGLCPLTTDTVYQDGCFPSKIVSYLSNGLMVYTTENRVIRNSLYKEYIYFVKDDSPQSFASSILRTSKNGYKDPRDRIIKLDQDFRRDILRLYREINGN